MSLRNFSDFSCRRMSSVTQTHSRHLSCNWNSSSHASCISRQTASNYVGLETSWNPQEPDIDDFDIVTVIHYYQAERGTSTCFLLLRFERSKPFLNRTSTVKDDESEHQNCVFVVVRIMGCSYCVILENQLFAHPNKPSYKKIGTKFHTHTMQVQHHTSRPSGQADPMSSPRSIVGLGASSGSNVAFVSSDYLRSREDFNNFNKVVPQQQMTSLRGSLGERKRLLREEEYESQYEPPHEKLCGSAIHRIPCKARGVSKNHSAENAFFDVPGDAPHGLLLQCSSEECTSSLRRFRYCRGKQIRV
jgi:hypothetical protein